MPVKDADPAAAQLDTAFAEALGAPARPKEPAAPPEIDPDAPHGRDDSGAPLAPFGLTKEGKPRRSNAGRKSKDDQARTGPEQPAAELAKDGTPIPAKDYSEALSSTVDGAWLMLTAAGQLPLEKIPLLGKIPIGKGRTLGGKLAGAGPRLQAQAAVLHANGPQLVTAVNIAAQNNARAKRLAEKLETGDITWVMIVSALAGPFIIQSRELWSGGVDVQALAKENEETFATWIEEIKAVMEQAQQPAAAEQGLALVQPPAQQEAT